MFIKNRLLKKVSVLLSAFMLFEAALPQSAAATLVQEKETVNTAVLHAEIEKSEPEEETVAKDEVLVDDYTGLMPVYANTSGIIDTSKEGIIIGYTRFNEATRSATYYYATGSSLTPLGISSVRVPAKIVVTKDTEGKDVAYDYTDGYALTPDGYAIQNQYDAEEGKDSTGGVYISVQDYMDKQREAGGVITEKTKYIEYVSELVDTVSGDGITDIKINKPVYIGKAYDVTALDKNVFKSENILPLIDSLISVSIPVSITSELNAGYFSLLAYLQKLEVYGGLDTKLPYIYYYNVDCNKVQTTYASKDSGGTDAFVSDVLVDTHYDSLTTPATILYCPPKYQKATYKYWYGKKTGIRSEIADGAFKNCVNLKNIEPLVVGTQTIVKIGNSAFEGCKELQNVKIFSNVLESIGDKAFKDCSALTEVNFNISQNTTLGKSVFDGTKIETINIPFGYNSMTGETFKGMDYLTAINVVDGSLTDDEAKNRYYFSKGGILYRYDVPGEEAKIDDGIELVRYPSKCLTSAVRPGTSEEIREKAFLVPYQVTAFDEYSFYDCETNLRYLYVPSTIQDIGVNRFHNCKALSEVYFYSGLWNLSIDAENYASVNLFDDCYSRLKIYAGTDTPVYKYAQKNSTVTAMALYNAEDYTFSGASLTAYEPAIAADTDIVIPNYYMSGDGVLHTVTGVNDHALANETITSVLFLHDMKEVSESAFYIVADKENIENDANINAKMLSTIYVEEGNNNLATDKGVLYKQRYNTKTKEYEPYELVYYPAGSDMVTYTTLKGMESLPEYAFWGAYNLRYLNIYDSIQEIGYNKDKNTTDEPSAFWGCRNLVKINIIPDEGTIATNIRYYSDDGVLYLWDPNSGKNGAPVTLIYYPKGKREMDIDSTSHVSYVVAEGCEEIRDMKDCIYLNSVTFPKSVKIIDEGAFSGSVNLTSITFRENGSGEGIKYIEDNAFASTALQELALPATIMSIGKRAFYDCYEMKSVKIDGNSLEIIGEEAFYRSTTTDGRPELKTNSGGALTSVVINCSDNKKTGGNLIIEPSAFAGSTMLEKLAITNMGRVSIGQYAFRECIALRGIDFSGTNVKEMGLRCFGSCEALEEIDLSPCAALEEIPSYAFFGCSSLQSVILPSNLKEIGSHAFQDCVYLDTINLANMTVLSTINDFAFANTGFVSMVIPDGVEHLGDSVFYGCDVLYTFYIPESVIFYETDGVYTDTSKKGPFRGYDKSAYVYGVEGSDVDLYIQYMDAHGYDAPTFLGSDHLPVAVVDLKQSDIEVYDVGDYRPELNVVVSSTDNLTDYSVVWFVRDGSVCQILNETFDGKDTSSCNVQGLAQGNTRIYCVNRQSGASDYCNVTVKSAGIDVNPTEADAVVETTEIFKLPKSISINCKGSNKKSILNATSDPPRKVYYKSSNKRIASVNKKGIVTGKHPGSTTIIVYAGSADTYVEEEVTVNVYMPEIKLSDKKKSLFAQGEGNSCELTVAHAGVKEEVTWTSSNPALVAVEGNNESAVVTVLKDTGKRQKVTITAECNGLKAKCKVTVTPCTITLDTNSLTMYAGKNTHETYQLINADIRHLSSHTDPYHFRVHFLKRSRRQIVRRAVGQFRR